MGRFGKKSLEGKVAEISKKRNSGKILLYVGVGAVFLTMIAYNIACSNKEKPVNPRSAETEQVDDDFQGGGDDTFLDDDSNEGDYVCEGEGMEITPATKILSPQNRAKYYSLPMLNLDGNLTNNGEIYLDEELINICPGEMINVQEGEHRISLYREGDFVDEVTFKINHLENIINKTTINNLPATYRLDNNRGLTLIDLRIENLGDTIHYLRFAGSKQPDLQDIHDTVNFIIGSETDSEKQAVSIYDWYINQVIHVLPTTREVESDRFPDQIADMGYGACSNQAEFLAQMWEAAGFSSRICALGGHVVPEVCWESDCDSNKDNSEKWHMMDPDTISYYRSDIDNHILSVEEIANNADLIMDYTDQSGHSLGDSPMEHYVDIYSPQEPNQCNPNRQFESDAGPGIEMQPGDILNFFPRGFNTYVCENCEEEPEIVGTGIHSRNALLENQQTTISLPFPIDRAFITLKNVKPIENEGKVTINFTTHGRIDNEQKEFNRNVTQTIYENQGKVFFDLYWAFDDNTMGFIDKLDVEIKLNDLTIESAKIHSVFQFGYRFIQLSESDPILNIRGESTGNTNLDITLETYHGQIQYDPRKSQLETGSLFPLRVPADGKKMGRLMATVRDSNGNLASGNKLELICDKDIEILTSPEVGIDRIISAPNTPYLPPNPWMDWLGEDSKRAFYLRSSNYIGQVNCEMFINEEPIGKTAKVNFISP
ncbi:MAG: hypothetical protein ACTSWC_09400 [Promethearchaeota archaeon]